MFFRRKKQKQRPSLVMGVEDINKLKKFLAVFDDPRIFVTIDKYAGDKLAEGRLYIKSVGDENSEIKHSFKSSDLFHLLEDMNKWYMKNRHHFVVLDNVLEDPNEETKQ